MKKKRTVNLNQKSRKAVVVNTMHTIAIILVLSVFISAFYNFGEQDYKTESALFSDAVDSVVFDGVFIRDETVLEYNGTGVLSYNVSDGGRLGSGSVIAEVYSSENQIQQMQEFEKLNDELELLQKIQNPGTVESAEPSNVSLLIEEKYRNIAYYRDKNDYATIDEKKDEFLIAMSTYQIITDPTVSFSEQIASVSSSINSLKLNSISPINQVVSTSSAYFVSFCDGYEDKINKDMIDDLTVDFLTSVKDEKIKSSSVIGKTIDSYQWYIAGVIDNSKKEYEIGNSVDLKFEGSDNKLQGKIIEIRDEGDPAKTIAIVSCNDFTQDLVQHRVEKVEMIKGEYEGLEVSRQAIRFKDITETVTDENGMEVEVVTSYKGVNVLQGEQVVFKKIDVVYEGNDYVISKFEEGRSGYLALYDDIIVDGV